MGKRRGRFCWMCGRRRANERFSGRGRHDNVCKDCARQGKQARVVAQAVRDMEQVTNTDGIIRRKHRAFVERLLEHPDEGVREAARQHLEIDRQVRAYYRELGRLERAREEVDILQSRLRFAHETLRKRHGLDQTPVPPPRVWDDDDIPF